jgi:hypothetical protein
MMEETRNDQGVVRKYGEFTIGAWLIAESESSPKTVISAPTPNNEICELSEQIADIQTDQKQGDQSAHLGPTGRQHSVAPGPPPEGEHSTMSDSTGAEPVRKPLSRKATGPRTPEGKRRSRYNARKHGICSKELLLKNESLAEFESLRNGLWEEFQPQGKLEAEVLNDLFVVRLIKRRARKALNATFAEEVDFSELDRSTAQEANAWDSEEWGGAQGGMLKPGCNHFVLGKGIELLQEIRSSVEARGFNVAKDRDVLKKLYGIDSDGKARSGLFSFYLLAASCASVRHEGKQNTDPDALKKHMIELLDEEIRALTALRNAVLDLERERRKYRVAQALFSCQAAMDLYIRYDTHMSRETDRLLNQLERLQRMRKGQPPPPQLDVKIS